MVRYCPLDTQFIDTQLHSDNDGYVQFSVILGSNTSSVQERLSQYELVFI